jgi:membrane protein YdbS with pleckstrin-like domain
LWFWRWFVTSILVCYSLFMTQDESKLKNQYPLSPRKFKKKMIEKTIVLFFVSVLFAVFAAIMIFSINQSVDLSKTILLSAFIFVILFALLMTIYGIYVHYYIKTYYYEDEDGFLTIRKGVITPSQIHVQYAKIQDVYVDQDLLDRIFGIYDVHISSATYTSGIEAHIDGVNKASAEALKNLFLHKIRGGSHNNVNNNTANAVENNQSISETHTKIAHFSKPISSDAYGLSSNWWTGEFVKIILGSIFYPAVIVLWLTFSGKNTENIKNWNMIFFIWLCVLVVYVIYRFTYIYLWKKHYKYEFGPEYIFMKIGVISISEKNMGYNTIQDVRINQNLVDRIFGVADLIIENASGSNMPINPRAKEAVFNGIVVEGLSLKDARFVSDELKRVISNKKDLTKGL